MDKNKTRELRTRLEVTKTSRFSVGQSHGREQESGRVREISNMFDILLTLHDKLGTTTDPNTAPDPRKNP